MLHREQELQRTKLIQKAYSLPYADKRAVTYQIKLRVVREFGLPDSAVEILQNSQYYYPEESQYVERQYQVNSSSSSSSPSRHKHSPSTPVPSPTRSYSPAVVSCPQVTTLDCVAHCTTHPDLKHSPSTPVPSPTRCYSPVQVRFTYLPIIKFDVCYLCSIKLNKNTILLNPIFYSFYF